MSPEFSDLSALSLSQEGQRPLALDFTYRILTNAQLEKTMKIIAFDRFKDGVTLETIQPLLEEEVSNVWRLWKAGIVRENYARADELGVVIIFEVPDVATAKAYTDDFPLSKAGYLEWSFIALQIPLPIETLFRNGLDLQEPFDRTLSDETQKVAQ
jgi:hypothetical protein